MKQWLLLLAALTSGGWYPVLVLHDADHRIVVYPYQNFGSPFRAQPDCEAFERSDPDFNAEYLDTFLNVVVDGGTVDKGCSLQ